MLEAHWLIHTTHLPYLSPPGSSPASPLGGQPEQSVRQRNDHADTKWWETYSPEYDKGEVGTKTEVYLRISEQYQGLIDGLFVGL